MTALSQVPLLKTCRTTGFVLSVAQRKSSLRRLSKYPGPLGPGFDHPWKRIVCGHPSVLEWLDWFPWLTNKTNLTNVTNITVFYGNIREVNSKWQLMMLFCFGLTLFKLGRKYTSTAVHGKATGRLWAPVSVK